MSELRGKETMSELRAKDTLTTVLGVGDRCAVCTSHNVDAKHRLSDEVIVHYHIDLWVGAWQLSVSTS